MLSLSSLDVDVMQQRMAYGIGVLHNRLLRRGLDPAVEPVMAPVGFVRMWPFFSMAWASIQRCMHTGRNQEQEDGFHQYSLACRKNRRRMNLTVSCIHYI